jgi:glyoxylase-like metal-dependent hydrolase (beta-lactamase superfamily II)
VVSGRRVRAYHTPGHAWHHLAYLDAERRAVFTGDVGGVRMRNIPYVAAPTPPPDIDLPAWKQSIGRIRELEPRRLYLAHYGAVDDVAWHLDALEARLETLESWLRSRLASVTDSAALGAELRDDVRAECAQIAGPTAAQLTDAYEFAAPSWMNLDGLRRYLSLPNTPGPDKVST